MTRGNTKDDGFNTSVPDLLAQFRDIKDRLLNHPSIPRPWPRWVSTPEKLDRQFDYLEKTYQEVAPGDVQSIKLLNKARRETKTEMGRLLRYVEMTLTGSRHLPPGFDLRRNPGLTTGGAAYRAPLPGDEFPADRSGRELFPEPRIKQAFLVRVVRPVFEAAYLEVRANDREEALERALASVPQIAEDQWIGTNDPDDYFIDANCVHSGQTSDGHPFSLLDFSRYSVISTNPRPVQPAFAVLPPWMSSAGPMLVASFLSEWIDQLLDSQGELYETAIEDLEEALEEWKGTDDEKVVPLKDPGERRFRLELAAMVMEGINMLKEPE